MNIQTATPVEIDTELGRLYTEAFPHRMTIESANETVFNLVRGTEGDKPVEIRTYATAEERARKLAKQLPSVLAKLDAARAALVPLKAAEEPLEAEYEARGRWSRFFLVTSSDGGHIHSSMSCSTCNVRTQFHWYPEFSGMTMTEAIAAWDKRGSAEILCSVCFPEAPVARTVAQVPDTQCPGSLTFNYDRKTARLGYYSGNFATCNDCGQVITVTKSNKLRKHDKTPAAPKPNENAPTADGSDLTIKTRHGNETFKTERSATSWVVREIGTHREYGYQVSQEGVDTVIKALAEKHGKTVAEITEEIETKVTAWTKREQRR